VYQLPKKRRESSRRGEEKRDDVCCSFATEESLYLYVQKGCWSGEKIDGKQDSNMTDSI